MRLMGLPGDWRSEATGGVEWRIVPALGSVSGGDLEKAFQSSSCLAGSRGRGSIKRLLIGGTFFLLRETRKGGLLRFLRGKGFASPARFYGEIRASERLKAAGISTPEILALRMERLSSGRWRGWILQTVVEGNTIEDILWQDGGNAQTLYLEAARLAARMAEAGVLHRDFHPANVMVDLENRLWALDLDKARLYEGAVPPGCAGSMLLRFLRYIQKMRAFGAPVPEDWDAAFLQAGMADAAVRRALEDALEFQRALLPLRRLFWKPLRPPFVDISEKLA